jgi:hypothetical protein
VWVRFRLSTTSGTGVFSITDSGNNWLGLVSAATFTFDKSIAGVTSNTVLTGMGSAQAGQVVDFVVTRAAGVLTYYLNGLQLGNTDATAGWNWTSSAIFKVGGYFTAGQNYDDRIYRAVLFNRALSAQDVADLVVNGVDEADQWGTQTQVINASTLNGGFETAGAGGADVFASISEFTSGTGALSRDTVTFNSGAASCRIQPGASGSAAVYWTAGTLPIGKRFRLTFTAKAASGTPAINVADVNSSVTFANQALTTSWAPYSLEAVNTGIGTSPKLTVSAANADVNLDLVVLERIGAMVDLNLGEGAGLCFTDRSSNGLHSTVFGSGISHVVAGRVGCVRVRTTAGGGIQLGGSNPVIPLNGRIRCITADAVSGTPTVTMGNVAAGTQHVASVALTAGLNDLTVVNRFNTTGNLWVNVSVTATVDWTVIYDLVD